MGKKAPARRTGTVADIPMTEAQAEAPTLPEGTAVRLLADLKAFPGDSEPHTYAGRDGTVVQALPGGDMFRVEIAGVDGAQMLRRDEFTVLQVHDQPTDYREVSPADIVPSPTNPRRRSGLTIDSLAGLAANIRAIGILQPIVVRPLPASRVEETSTMSPRPSLELVAGERRWRGAQIAELAKVPVLVGDLTDEQVWEMQVAENVEREDLDDLEEADGLRIMRDKLGMSVAQIAARTGRGKGESYITKALKLTELGDYAREKMYPQGTATVPVLNRSTALLVARYGHELQPDVVDFIASLARDGEPAPFREVQPAVYKRFNLALARAVFDITDASLVMGVPACTACPKRTGNQGEMFSDGAAAEDSCTDAECFDSKRKALVSRIRAQAFKDGIKVLDDDEARRARPTVAHKGLIGWVKLSDVAHTVEDPNVGTREVTFQEALAGLGRKAPKPRLFIDPHTDEAYRVISASLAEQLTPKAEEEPDSERGGGRQVGGALTTQSTADSLSAAQEDGDDGDEATAETRSDKPVEQDDDGPARREPEPRAPRTTSAEEDALAVPEVARALFIRLFDAIRHRDPSQHSRVRQGAELAAVTAAIFGYGDRIGFVEEYLGWAEDLEHCDDNEHAPLVYEKVEQMPPEEQVQIIVMAALERYLTHYMVGPLDQIDLFKAYGVDVLAVRDKVAADLAAQEGQV